jgi:hypothetical protein
MSEQRQAGQRTCAHSALHLNRYPEVVASGQKKAPTHSDTPPRGGVRDPLAVPEAVIAARRRPMSERLELALSWNAVAAELRRGMAAATGDNVNR